MRKSLWVLAALLLGSCSDSATEPDGGSLLTGSWHLQSMARPDGAITVVADPSRYTATFDSQGRLGVRADCNQCASSYAAEGGDLAIGSLACTRAYCGAESLFDDYVSALDGASSFEATAAALTVRSPGTTLRFLRQ